MRKVHPKAAGSGAGEEKGGGEGEGEGEGEVLMMTVWKKSLVPNCKGFTVFDCGGNIVFRVDNYCGRSRSNKDEILLMDAAGTPLLTIRRKRAGLGEKWEVYEGEGLGEKAAYWGKKEAMKGRVVSMCSSGSRYEIEGSYAQRCCSVYDHHRRRVAEIRRKESSVGGVAFGADVFRLILHPHLIHPSLAMAFLILLDQIS